MSFIIFLAIILIMLGIVIFISMVHIVKENEEKMVLAQLIEESDKWKDMDKIRETYNREEYSSKLYDMYFEENSFCVKDKKNRSNGVQKFNYEDIVDIKKEYNGKKIDIPGHNFVWSGYGITIKYKVNRGIETKTFWFNEEIQNLFDLIDNVKVNVFADAIIYKVLKQKNVA